MLVTLLRRVLIGVTAVGAIVASFIFLTDLAVQTGWPPEAAILIPLCVDALAIMALLQYRHDGRKSAAVVAVFAIALSSTGNAVSHLMSTGFLVPNWVAVSLVGAVPAVSFGVCVHLTVPRRGGNRWSTDTGAASETGSASSDVSGSATPTRTLVSGVGRPASTPKRTASSGRPRSTTRRSSKPHGSKLPIGDVTESDLRTLSLNGLTSKYAMSKSTAKRLRDDLEASEVRGTSSRSKDLTLVGGET